jgi:hypothetical protein
MILVAAGGSLCPVDDSDQPNHFWVYNGITWNYSGNRFTCAAFHRFVSIHAYVGAEHSITSLQSVGQETEIFELDIKLEASQQRASGGCQLKGKLLGGVCVSGKA